MRHWYMLFFLVLGNAYAQTAPIWVNNLGGPAFGDQAYGVAVDASDHIYVGGDFSSTVDFDPGPGLLELTTTTVDPYLAKYDDAGDIIWAKHLSGFGRVTDIIVDSNNDVIVAGQFSNSLVVDPTLTLDAISSRDIFLIKFDPHGNLIWGFSVGGNGDDYPQSIALDSTNAVVVSGTIRIAADFDPGPNMAELVAGVDEDSFVAKYTSNGDYVWARLFEQLTASGIAQSDSAHAVVIGPMDEVYVAGQAEGTLDFSGTPVDATGTAAYIVKYDAAGVLRWVKTTAGTGLRTEHFAMGRDDSGNLYAAGMFIGVADFDPDPVGEVNGDSDESLDIYLVSYDANGDFRWLSPIPSTSTHQVFDIHVRPDGSATIAGTFSGIADFDPDIGVEERTSNTSAGDCYFAHYAPDGALISAQHLPGTFNFNGQANCVIQAIAPAAGGDLAMAGQYRRQVDFDPGPGEFFLTPVSVIDGFVARYGQPLLSVIFMDGFEDPSP